MGKSTRGQRETQLPREISHLPAKPVNGNYILITTELEGYGNWVHAESLPEAYSEFRRGHGYCPFRRKLGGLAVLDVSDDFRIYHVDGSVSAEKLNAVYLSGCYAEQ